MNMNKTAIALSTGLLMTALAVTGALAHSDSGTTQQTLPKSTSHMPNNESLGVGGMMGMHGNANNHSDHMGHGRMSGGMMGDGMMGPHHNSRNQENPHNPALRNNSAFDKKLSSEDIRKILTGHLLSMGNKRLKVGDISQQDDGKFLADITTVDDSLVMRMNVDPKTGAMQPVTE